ncbi:MAG: Appr-1-p processing protein [Robiginitomaculum sp.]|nr:MAG: Appr-1-p processing protein [Robiginitomaculum sp.]
MIKFTTGNLLKADVEAVVNTVNTVGVMGKGIALMFKEAFPANFDAYFKACKAKQVKTGTMFVTENLQLMGPRWIINFPTKTHWRVKTKLEWVESGLIDLVRVIENRDIKSIAIPPLGCGNGGLDWSTVRPMIFSALEPIQGVEIVVFEPTGKYQNVAKRTGVKKLTPARALVAEMVRRYALLGIECSILEVQKLGWFLERGARLIGKEGSLNFEFSANKYGPYSERMRHLLDSLDGSYLNCDKRLGDAGPNDLISFRDDQKEFVQTYLRSGEGKEFAPVLEWAASIIDGFESPLGMELLATVDWLVQRESVDYDVSSIKSALGTWAGGKQAGLRKLKIFDDRLIEIAMAQLKDANSDGSQYIQN